MDVDFVLNQLVEEVSGKPADLCKQVKQMIRTRAGTRKEKRLSRSLRDRTRTEIQDSSDSDESETDSDGWPGDSSESSEHEQFNDYTASNDKTDRGGDDGNEDDEGTLAN